MDEKEARRIISDRTISEGDGSCHCVEHEKYRCARAYLSALNGPEFFALKKENEELKKTLFGISEVNKYGPPESEALLKKGL